MTRTAQTTPAITERKERDDYRRSVTIMRNRAGREAAIILLPKTVTGPRYLVNLDRLNSAHAKVVRLRTRKDARLLAIETLLA